jgi:hypothetical protein
MFEGELDRVTEHMRYLKYKTNSSLFLELVETSDISDANSGKSRLTNWAWFRQLLAGNQED